MSNIFLFAERLSGFRKATAREHRSKADWAKEVAHLLDTHYAETGNVVLFRFNQTGSARVS